MLKVAVFLVAIPMVQSSCARQTLGDAGDAAFYRVLPLADGESVFAYSRISPDGRNLVYAAEDPGGLALQRVIRLVDLETREVVFSERGIDAYFSPDGRRMIYLSYAGTFPTVSIRDNVTGEVFRGVAPENLGDYYSWGVREGENIILTINSNYYHLDGNIGVMPNLRVPACPGIGIGERPLISKDGERITTFVRGRVYVRGIDNCDRVIDTGMEGGKADFSFDGRYIALHAPRASGGGYDVYVVDLVDRTSRAVTASLKGSSLFPSWTADGKLSFRYDGEDYRGFMMADNVLSVPAKPLPGFRTPAVPGGEPLTLPPPQVWDAVFPETRAPDARVVAVLIWGPWSAHAPDALRDMESAAAELKARGSDVMLLTATDPFSSERDVNRLLTRYGISLPRIPLAAERLRLTSLHNQNPAMLLFVNGELRDRRLGALTRDELLAWISSVQPVSARTVGRIATARRLRLSGWSVSP